jgi:hypothetical protein
LSNERVNEAVQRAKSAEILGGRAIVANTQAVLPKTCMVSSALLTHARLLKIVAAEA